MRESFRFFRVVPPVPSLMRTTFVVITTVSAIAITIDPRVASGTIDAMIVLQLFAVSTGFAGYARRGYYDLLLTRGERRWQIALAHWLLAIAPGCVSWMVVSIVDAIVGGGHVAFASGTVVALLVVSMIGWSTTAALPRFAGAIGWVVVLAMGVALAPGIPVPPAVVNIVYPLGMVGRSARADPLAVLSAMGVAIVTMAGALAWVDRASLPLEAAQ